MNFSTKPSSRVKILFIGILVFILVCNVTPLGDVIQNYYFQISSPLQATFWSRGISMQSKEVENEDRLLGEVTDLQRKIDEFKEIESLFEEVENEKFQYSGARVVGKPTESDYLIISKGEEDGIEKGMPVVDSSKNLVGKVYKTLSDFSHVQLVTNKDTSFDARILNKEGSLGVLENTKDGLTLSMVERSVELSEGDMVVTHPEGGIYPGGIFIGQVEEVNKDDVKAFQSAKVSLGFNSKETTYLFVITEF